ncbi:MAG: tetratricopeptide repeat protein, partial [Aestuariivirgaceae bacterium]
LQLDRENVAALAGLAKCQIEAGDIEGAEATLALVQPGKEDDAEIASARAALELAATPADTGEIGRLSDEVAADKANHQARFDLALALNAAGNREEALDHLLTLFQVQRDWNDDAARKQLLVFFEAWGPSDELTVSGRRRLSSIMFS